MEKIARAITLKTRNSSLKSPHLFAIIIISVALTLLYLKWPWIDWEPIRNFSPSWLENLASFEFKNRVLGSLFLVPILYGAIVFWWRGALVAWLLSLAGVLPLIIRIWHFNPHTMITNLAFLIMPLLIVSILAFELEWRSKEKKMLAGREAERQRYIAKVLETQENERQHIAQELHDDTIQTLLVILSHTDELLSTDHLELSRVKENATQIRDTTVNVVENVRRLSINLRPSILDNLGLIPALRWLVDRMNTDSNIQSKITITGTERKLSPRAESAIFRIVQEALNNVRRHSRASHASVSLEFSNNNLNIKIQDDGHGFSAPREIGWFANKGSLGLIGMQQRINSLGGTFQIRSSPNEGTMLSFDLPS